MNVPYLANYAEIAKITEGLPGSLFSDTFTVEINNPNSEPWLALLRSFGNEADEPKNRGRRIHTNHVTSTVPTEVRGPLQKVAESPFRSLGGFLDYSNWADRERFLELDRAIACAQSNQETDDDEFDSRIV